MKQIERDGSPQRAVCALLEQQPGMTVAEISAARAVNNRAIGRQLDMLMRDGFVRREGYPRLYFWTGKPIPDVVPRTPDAERAAARARRDRTEVSNPFGLGARGDLERVFLSWVGGI